MANLRIIGIRVVDSTTILAQFTEELDPYIIPDNVQIASNIVGVPDPAVLSVAINKQILSITTQPLTPFASYFMTFRSTPLIKFRSKNGQSYLLEDGNTNVILIIGAEDPVDPVRDNLISFLKDNIYNLDSSTTVRSIINSISQNITKALYDVGQLKNDNYLNKVVADEIKTRGSGPYDRLSEEGAYEVTRVSKHPRDATLSTSFSYTSFPRDPVTLQRTDVTGERISLGYGIDVFDPTILTLFHNPVTKVKSITFVYSLGGTYVYDISRLGYQLNNPRYDTSHASTLLTLSDDQVKLNSQILEEGFVPPATGDYALINYEFKSLGIDADASTVVVSQVLQSVREVVPPLLTTFALKHFPIISASDTAITSNGVQFLDPNANPPFSATHPAFTREIPYRVQAPPSRPGEFSVDYLTGNVFVYGQTTGDGTGNYPPVATYYYRNIFSSRLDYTFNEDIQELVANPLRSLIGEAAKISFNFENNLVPGTDYVAQVHNEQIDERIGNSLRASNSLTAKHSPITNVFRVFNETIGEIYTPTRWRDNVIYFSSTTPPRIFEQLHERVTFTDVLNEALTVDVDEVNAFSVRILKILLQNNRIMSSTEDVIGSSYNTSVIFSRTDIFRTEQYYDGQISTVPININRLIVGAYQIDYQNGIVYVGVSNAQDFDLGTISYKKAIISPANPHVIGVSELYYSIDQLSGINKTITYGSVSDGAVEPIVFDISDERFLNKDTLLPYFVNAGTILVTDDIKDVRHIFDGYDLRFSLSPIDFAVGATVSANIITLDPTGVDHQEDSIVSGSNTVVLSSLIAPAIEITSVMSVVRLSDGYELFDTGGSFTGNTITLSGAHSPLPGQAVSVICKVILNGSATPIVDYNRGDYFMDYTYLADEILISYEYGDNVLDFRQGDALSEGDTYYVSYKVGALRDALLKNFGALVDLPIMKSFDTTLARERYRDALIAALQSFTKGPTIPAMKSLVSNITKIDPELIESVFEGWSLGISYLYPNSIKTTGNVQLMPGKYDNGVLIDSSGQTITLPIVSNLRLERGTLETWVIPEWDGLDNDATLTFSSLTRDGYVLDVNDIYIGASSFHPTYDDNNTFALNRKDEPSPIGLPSSAFTATHGMFIHYDDVDKRWRMYVKDLMVDGYVYAGTILSSGEVYDVKFVPYLSAPDDQLRSYSNKIEFILNIDASDNPDPDGYIDGYIPSRDGYMPGYSFDGISFLADDEHYIFDFGKDEGTSRFSIFKDGRGYLNFQVFDKGNKGRKNSYKVSADISDWRAGEKHHVATSWIINSSDRRDEMHLFIDGQEVPNILRYGGRPIASATDRFRTVKPEIVVGSVLKKAITAADLITTAGLSVVTSPSVNFAQEYADGYINYGDTVEILELGFGTYTIQPGGILGHTLTLSSTMPQSLSNVRFSVNPFSTVVSSEIDLYSNIIVSVLRGATEAEIPGVRAVVPEYSISKNIFNQNILTILGDVYPGDTVLLRTLGLNHRRARDRVYVWGADDGYGSAVLRTRLPPPIDLNQTKITSVIQPLVPIGPTSGAVITGGGHFITTLYHPTAADGYNPVDGYHALSQPDNLLMRESMNEGRMLSVRMTGSSNADWTSPVTVQINGTTVSGATTEILTFSGTGTQTTIELFKTITDVVIDAKPINTTKDSVSIEIKETQPITDGYGNSIFAVIRYSYKVANGLKLSGIGGTNTVTDGYGQFVQSMIGDILVIKPPISSTHVITGITDANNLTITPAVPTTFTLGTYDIFDVTMGRSGFQNGYFYLEAVGISVNDGYATPFILPRGVYEFDYPTYLEIPFDAVTNMKGFIGSDLRGNKQAKAIIDEFRSLSVMMTDTRIGETIPDTANSITTDYISLRAFLPDKNTLSLIHFDSIPFTDGADFWVMADRNFRQADVSVNGSFEQSLLITDQPFIIDNRGILNTNGEGTIEFWVSPRYDTFNDPNFRFYFDASSIVVESVTSTSAAAVKVSGRVGQVVSVRLATDTDNTGVDYFVGGRLGTDFQTIILGKALPFQQTPVKVSYVPSGLSGDRISIYKDIDGFLVFNIRAGGQDYQVRHAIFWQRDTWHRVRASFKLNRSDNLDELRLFVDGEERSVILFGNGLLFGSDAIFGSEFINSSSAMLIADINFRDPVNEIYIGSDYLGAHTAQARMDNLRISNIARRLTNVSGQPKDVNFSMNINTVLPVVPDAFTTYLLDFDSLLVKIEDFALLKNAQFGIFDFTLNVIDSYSIVSGSLKIKQILEELIGALKPAQSRATINYIK